MLLLFFIFISLQNVIAEVNPKRNLTLTEKNKLSRLVSDANKGYDVACYKLGMAYLEGRLIRQSYPDAVKWLTVSAEQGHVRSMYTVAMLFSRGKGVKTNFTESFRWIKKLAEKVTGWPNIIWEKCTKQDMELKKIRTWLVSG